MFSGVAAPPIRTVGSAWSRTALRSEGRMPRRLREGIDLGDDAVLIAVIFGGGHYAHGAVAGAEDDRVRAAPSSSGSGSPGLYIVA